MKKLVALTILSLCILPFSLAQKVRKPVWSGQFYPGEKKILSQMIDEFLEQAQVPEIKGEIKALIVPHAGYIYSGKIAAHSYRLVKGKNYETVIIIGPSHHYGFNGYSIYPSGYYQTPLGLVKIDEILAQEIIKNSPFKYIPKAHNKEHSIEVQIPFIQKVLSKAKIVPIVMGYQTKKTITTLAQVLAETIKGKNVLLVASNDMSHYFSKRKANKIDKNTISLIKAFNTKKLITKIERRENIMCGGGPVVSAMLTAHSLGETEVEILKYGDSSETGGPKDRVVGYLSAAIFLPLKEETFTLSQEEKKELLKIARQTIEKFILEKEIPQFKINHKNLLEKRAAFVTIKERGMLRGCIGFTEPILPLYQTVIQSAILAATRDLRFPPLSSEEINHIELEISVLTPLKKITNPNQIIVGKHGLVVSKQGKKGLLLPQVPVENNWGRNEFLNQICFKAGLPRNCWRENALLYTFEAIVFDESLIKE
ncbi:MAG: AmmeMemoRadiSam system protein B [Candidatus Aminicenantia bacterium]